MLEFVLIPTSAWQVDFCLDFVSAFYIDTFCLSFFHRLIRDHEQEENATLREEKWMHDSILHKFIKLFTFVLCLPNVFYRLYKLLAFSFDLLFNCEFKN